ncbi:MAG: response regulator [Desulfuromonadales bacterium]|nr:response regulator [Desulfuromonadales bacterium]
MTHEDLDTAQMDVKKPVILIVDDDANNLAVVSDCLTGFNFTVLVAEDGESAVSRADYALPDLILLDIMMPGMDGYETCRRLKLQDSTRDIPVIFMSALDETGHKVQGLEAGAVDYVTKPFHQEELLARVGVHLSIRELNRRLVEANKLLEARVEERTRELAITNRELEVEIAERQAAQEQLQKQTVILEEKVEELLAAQKALRTSEQKFRAIFDQSFQLIGLTTPEGIILEVNRTALDFGVAAESDVLNRPFWESPWWTYSPEQREHVRKAVQQAASGEFARFETIHLTPDGATHYFDYSLKPILDEQGTVVMLIPEGRDITSHKKLEDQLRQSQKMEAIGTLAGGVAHDFNNILTIIIGFGSLLRDKLKDDDSLTHILAAADKGAKLTHSLLTFSRKQIMETQPEEVNEIVRTIDKILRRVIGDDIAFHSRCTPEKLVIMADSGQMEQVLMNLAVNARDAMPRGGVLNLETERVELTEELPDPSLVPGSYARITVSDTGCGIDEEIRQRIFEPFFTTKEVGRGTGLGLSIVYGIIKQHGGVVTMQSEVSKGTCFRIYLPLIEAASTMLRESQPTTRMVGGTETILVAEDNDGVRHFLVKTLKDFGYQVIEAQNGEDALAKYRANCNRIQLMLLDVVMPGMNGREVCDAVKEEGGQVRVLFVSGFTADIIEQQGIVNKGAAFLAKPVTAHALLSKVREVLDRRR